MSSVEILAGMFVGCFAAVEYVSLAKAAQTSPALVLPVALTVEVAAATGALRARDTSVYESAAVVSESVRTCKSEPARNRLHLDHF